MKSKFTSCDVHAIVQHLQGDTQTPLLEHGINQDETARMSLLGNRIINIYDISSKIYILKFSSTSKSRSTNQLSEEVEKKSNILLIESGVRFHMTEYQRTLPTSPAPFTMILRKYLRGKRLDSIRQLGFDRVVDMQFGSGSGEFTCHLILEFYAGGNVVLTDGNYEVLALLRSHQFSEEVLLKVGEIYPIAFSTNLGENVLDLYKTWESKTEHTFHSFDNFRLWLMNKSVASVDINSIKSKKASKGLIFRQILLNRDSGVAHLGPEILDHCILKAGFKLNTKIEMLLSSFNQEQFQRLKLALIDAHDMIKMLESSQHCPGYIIIHDEATAKSDQPEFTEFTPFLLMQHEEKPYHIYSSFSETVDTYFYKIEDQKLQKELSVKEEAVKKKIQKVHDEHEKMISNLAAHQRQLQDAAILLEMHASEVDKACLVINSAIGADLSWDSIKDMVEMEQKKGNPIAKLISSMKLEDNVMTLRFPRSDISAFLGYDSDDDEMLESNEKEFVDIEIDFTLSARTNVSRLYSSKKAASAKEAKTSDAAEKVMKTMKEQAEKQLENRKGTATIKAARKVHWFEKFNWFITSEGFLVLSGRDAQQNDQLIRRYLKAEDVYVHADLSGAASCVIKAKKQDSEAMKGPAVMDAKEKFFVTPLAIQEAGIMAVCRSKAWNAKILTSSYWVRASQVSKTAPSGEYLSTGSFMIYGKKNYLPPMPLEMGFGLLFRLADDSIYRHLKDRKIRSYEMDSEASTSFQIADERYGISSSLTEEEEDTQMETLVSVEEESAKDETAVGITLDELPAEGDEEVDAEVEVDGSKEIEEEEEIDKAREREEQEGEKEEEEEEGEAEEEDSRPQRQRQSSSGQSGRQSKGASAKGSSSSKTGAAIPTPAPVPATRKKNISKKKARRYAEQDEEDRELAMLILGHASKSTGETLVDKISKVETEKKLVDIKARQSKAGIHLLQKDSDASLVLLSGPVKDSFLEMIEEGLIKHGDIGEQEIRSLSLFSMEDGLQVINLFKDGNKSLSKVSNKSGFLAGIIRRVMRDCEAKKLSGSSLSKGIVARESTAGVQLDGGDEDDEDDKLIEGEMSNTVDDLVRFTGNPLPEDNILYAIPMCGPYLSLQSMKFRIKLTPGNLKKGKASKTAADLFQRSKECTPAEKAAIKNLSDNELVAAMLGEVKLSMPGLQQHKSQMKKSKSSR